MVVVNLVEDDNTRPTPIHLGFRLGMNYLRAYLDALQEIGVNHAVVNLRFCRADTEATLKRLAAEVLPRFM